MAIGCSATVELTARQTAPILEVAIPALLIALPPPTRRTSLATGRTPSTRSGSSIG